MVLSGIDRFLTTLTLLAEKIEHRHSQRAGQLIQKAVIWWHEKFGSIRRRVEWHRKGIKILRAARRDLPRASPRYPSLSLSGEAISKTAEGLVEGILHVGNGNSIRLEELSWLKDHLGGTLSVSRLLFHALESVGNLVECYEKTGRLEYLSVAKALTQKWISECLHKEGIGEVWSDHGTGLRSIILCQLWIHCQKSEPEESLFMKHLCEAIIRHGEKLSNLSFYRGHHNHGIVQAYGLFAIGLCFSSYPMSAKWEAQGCARLEAQMANNVSPEGLHCEHSPYYHFFAFRHFFYAYLLAQANGKIFSPNYMARLKTMLQAGSYLIKPDLRLSAFGDTSKNSPILVENNERKEWPIQEAQEFLYSSSGGIEGYPPDEVSVSFPHAGFACLRSGWGTTEPFEEERYMSIRTATFPTTHIHPDVGSFELYAYGDDLIVDSGGPYAYGHPWREKYFLTTRAHNTVMVDGKDQRIGQSRIVRWETTEHYDFLQMEHGNYFGITHIRSVIFIRPSYFIVWDQLHSEAIHQYSQLFHLNERLQVARQGTLVTTENPSGGPTLRIVTFLKDNFRMTVHHGSRSAYQGWRCLAENYMVPTTALEYQQTGSSVQFGVLLIPEPPNQTIDTQVQVGEEHFPLGLHLKVQAGNREDKIQCSISGQLTVERKPLW